MTAERLRAQLTFHVAAIEDLEVLRRLVALAAAADPTPLPSTPAGDLVRDVEARGEVHRAAVDAFADALDNPGEAGEGRLSPRDDGA